MKLFKALSTFVLKTHFNFFVLSVTVLALTSSAATDAENKPIILTDTTFHTFLANNPTTVVLFYAPWCIWSRNVLPFFNQATEILLSQNDQIRMTTLDASRYTSIGEEYNIFSYPTVKFFVDSKTHTYPGIPYSSSNLLKWILNYVNSLIQLNTLDQFNIFESSHQKEPMMISFFDVNDSTIRGPLLSVSREVDKIRLFETHNRTLVDLILNKYKASETFKNHTQKASYFTFLIKPNARFILHIESPIVEYSEATPNTSVLIEMGRRYANPLVVHLDSTADALLVQQKHFVALLFTGKHRIPGYLTPAYSTFYHVAKDFSDDILFAYCDGSTELHKRLSELLGVPSSFENEILRVAKMLQTEFSRSHIQYQYRPSQEDINNWDPQSLKAYLSRLQNGKVKFYLKSEPIPDPNFNTAFGGNLLSIVLYEGPVYNLVADEFENQVFNSDKIILLEIYAPWCGHCRRMEKTLHDIALILKPLPNIRVMKIDGTLNEVPFYIFGYPSILLFTPQDNTTENVNPLNRKKTYFFQQERTVEGLLNWMSKHSPTPIDVPSLMHQFKKDYPQHIPTESLQSNRFFDEL